MGINFGGGSFAYTTVSLLLGVEKRLLLSDAETDISVGVISRSLIVSGVSLMVGVRSLTGAVVSLDSLCLCGWHMRGQHYITDVRVSGWA